MIQSSQLRISTKSTEFNWFLVESMIKDGTEYKTWHGKVQGGYNLAESHQTRYTLNLEQYHFCI